VKWGRLQDLAGIYLIILF